MKYKSKGMFRSLAYPNYQTWAIGALISNIGTWMQRTAQDWIVLTYLTDNNATALGIVMALQFGPHAILLPFSGYIADNFDRKKVLLVTQAVMGTLALLLGILTITNHITLWQVYLFALLLGCTTAFDAPARQTFVVELVPEKDLSNAVGLNSTSFNSARMIGPSVAAILINQIGTGWVFIINAVSYLAVIYSLLHLKEKDFYTSKRSTSIKGGYLEGFSYVWARPDLKSMFVMLFLIGVFCLNFPIFISTMAISEFHVGVKSFGFLMSLMAVGAVIGALLAAKQETPTMQSLITATIILTFGFIGAIFTPNYWFFGVMLILIGISIQTFNTTSNSLMQLATRPDMRGRVIAIRMAIVLGGTPIGAPIIGWVADHFGARWGLGVGFVAAALAGTTAIYYRAKHGRIQRRK